MGAEITITWLEHTAVELRRQAREHEGRVACRILAIAPVLDGLSRREGVQLCGMDRQTLRDWCIATTPTALLACRAGRVQAVLRLCRASR